MTTIAINTVRLGRAGGQSGAKGGEDGQVWRGSRIPYLYIVIRLYHIAFICFWYANGASNFPPFVYIPGIPGFQRNLLNDVFVPGKLNLPEPAVICLGYFGLKAAKAHYGSCCVRMLLYLNT